MKTTSSPHKIPVNSRGVSVRRIVVVVVCLFLCLGFALPAAQAQSALSIGESFEGEELSYKLGFWVLRNVARARVTFEKEQSKDSGRKNIFVATMTTQTTGVVRFVRDRSDYFIARMEEVDGGKRLRTVSFERSSVLGKKERRKLVVMDYGKGVMRWKKWQNGKLRKSGVIPIPKGAVFDDPLTAFYNLRYGVYGMAGSGKAFTIKTFPTSDGKDVEIVVRFADPDEFERQRKSRRSGAAFLAYARLDKELFDSNSGDIEIFFSPQMVVTYAVAKDVLLFGDVKGKLISRD